MKKRAPRNRTLNILPEEADDLLADTITLQHPVTPKQVSSRIICQDLFACIDYLPARFVDLLIIDPPYNLHKKFGSRKFSRMTPESYLLWLDSWLIKLVRCLKKTASIYVCCDWQSSAAIQMALQKYFIIRNRITWEREKGRGAKTNWKNCSEDIWFCTVSERYWFDVNAVKMKRRVLAPYRTGAGKPKDWQDSATGKYRLTHPSNLWNDISVPFWSMPENTDHPAQKPEKLIAKLILASSRPNDFILDPFAGSGTTCVVADKLGRRFVGIEREPEYCRMAVKRLLRAGTDKSIQGYQDGCFLERNTTVQKLDQDI